jgi:hypothetical protein
MLRISLLQDARAGTDDDKSNIVWCDHCAETPCVWWVERKNVIALVQTDHGDNTSVSDSSQRKTRFHCIWQVRNGVGQKGCRTRHL